MIRHWLDLLLPRVLFLATLLAALALAGAVLVVPWLEHFGFDLPPAVDLFGQDGTVRRTALASAAGLVVTAFVFFRPRKSAEKIKRQRPSDFVGA